MSTKTKAPAVTTMLADASVPLEHRKQLIMHLCSAGGEDTDALLKAFLDSAAAGTGQELHAAKAQELAEIIKQMNEGPLRSATFLQMLPGHGGVPRAQIVLPDGTRAFTIVPDVDLARTLRCGDDVLLEAQAKAVLCRDSAGTDTGEEARLERRVGTHCVEITLRDHERHIFRASDRLIHQLNAGEVTPGATVLVCQRRMLAFDAVPNPDGLSHFRYLAKEGPPDVIVERDIGAPPVFIEELIEHVRAEMTDPILSRRYRLRRATMKLLTGVSGSGKTLCIQGTWRRMYEVMSEITGTPLEDLPPRAMRLRMSEVTSKWLGESDKRIDRFFDEVNQLAEELYTAPDGKRWELPILAICEECDGLARARGDEAIYDRIQTTLLQRLDVTSQKLKDKLVIFLFTTNVPHVVDPAFLRRAGGTVEKFGRLGRRAFLAVLHKHLHGLPFASDNGRTKGDRTPKITGPVPFCPANGFDPTELQRRIAADVCGWLFSANGLDRGQVELTTVGTAQPIVKYRRDFLTGALVDRAVQQAATAARRRERQGTDRPGLTTAGLIRAFEHQVHSIVEQLHKDNVHNFLDLPDGVRVVQVRRIDQPAIQPFELERVS